MDHGSNETDPRIDPEDEENTLVRHHLQITPLRTPEHGPGAPATGAISVGLTLDVVTARGMERCPSDPLPFGQGSIAIHSLASLGNPYFENSFTPRATLRFG